MSFQYGRFGVLSTPNLAPHWAAGQLSGTASAVSRACAPSWSHDDGISILSMPIFVPCLHSRCLWFYSTKCSYVPLWGERNLFLHVETKLDGTIWASFIEEEHGIWNIVAGLNSMTGFGITIFALTEFGEHLLCGNEPNSSLNMYAGVGPICCLSKPVSRKLTEKNIVGLLLGTPRSPAIARVKSRMCHLASPSLVTIYVDSVGKQHDSIMFHVVQCPWVLWFPRSGGPKLKETQSYPSKFCSRVCSLHKTWCLETWLNLEFIWCFCILIYIMLIPQYKLRIQTPSLQFPTATSLNMGHTTLSLGGFCKHQEMRIHMQLMPGVMNWLKPNL